MTAEHLRGKTALVTGAARRLGREVALALGRRGVNVVVHYHRSAEEARCLGEELESLGVRQWLLQTDLADGDRREELISRAMAAAGGLDFLVNNASIYPEDSLESLSLQAFEKTIEVNAWAPFTLSRAFARLVGRGQIINLLDARLGGSDVNHRAYLLSKRLLADLTAITALEFAPDIRVNAVAPGIILPPPGNDEPYLLQLAKGVPLRQPGTPSDVAEAIIYLLGATYLTGQIIYVDGGRHLKG